MAINIDGRRKELEDARITFSILSNLVGLVSQEIYSRFTGMLTANSILIALIGVSLTSEHPFPWPLSVILPIIGVFLCIIWLLFNCHGTYWQDRYRSDARKIEEKYFNGFKIWRQDSSPYLKYRHLSIGVIIIFIIIYVALLLTATIASQVCLFKK